MRRKNFFLKMFAFLLFNFNIFKKMRTHESSAYLLQYIVKRK